MEADREKVLTPKRKKFLEEVYLREPYLIPEEIEACIESAVIRLQSQFKDKFICLTIFGGIANGSYIFRQAEGSLATEADLDYTLIVNSASKDDLRLMHGVILDELSELGMDTDQAIRVDDSEYSFDVNDIDGLLEDARFDLFSRPFECAYGDLEKAQAVILNIVRKHPRPKGFWQLIREYHLSSLLLAHKSFGDLNSVIEDRYYPTKVERFGLPEDFTSIESRGE